MTVRVADAQIHQPILDRWSRRAFDPDLVIDDTVLDSLFEAARWAPSAYNLQPWRFVLAKRGDESWSRMLDALIPFNKEWAQHSSVLIYVCSQTDTEGKDGACSPSYSHSFDTGAAWAYLALEASLRGLSAHAMTGFIPDVAHSAVSAPDNVRVDAIVALGVPGETAALPFGLRDREIPSHRNPIGSFVYDQSFQKRRR